MMNRTRTDILLIAGFCAFLFFYGLGQFGLLGADEPRYAQVAREMLEGSNWVTPVLGGKPWLEKPPLYYWQAMLAYKLFGVNDVAARIPSAFDATLLVLGVYLFFRRFRPGVELDAALITASSAGIVGFARAASMEMALAASVLWALLAWWAWHESGKRIYLAIFYASLGVGTLAKGPVAPFLSAVIVLCYATAMRRWRDVLKTVWLPGIILFCAIAGPWYVAVQMRNPEFFRVFILEHNLGRFSTDLYHHRQPFWFYVPVVVLGLMPWIVFVASATVQSLQIWWNERNSAATESDPELRFSVFACCWLLVPFLFFSFSQSKLPGYILPALPAGAVLLAEYLRQQQEYFDTVPKWRIVAHAIVASAPIAPAFLIAYLVTQHKAPGGQPLYVALGIALVLAVGIAATLLGRLGLRMLRFVTLIPVVLSVAAVLKLGPVAIDQMLSTRPLSQSIAEMETHPLPIAVSHVPRDIEYGLAFYRNQQVARYESSGVPAVEHLLVAPEGSQSGVVRQVGGRRVSFLGHYAPQRVDYFWVAAAGGPSSQ